MGVLQLGGLLISAYVDGTLMLQGSAVGLLEHPGMFAIVVGDAALFIVATYASQMTAKIGRKLPSRRARLTRRYYRSILWNWAVGPGGVFYWMFFLFSVVGALALINQSVQLFAPEAYYGHDTFDSARHPFSFWVNRVNLFTSWCIVVPLFCSYLFTHSVLVSVYLRRSAKHGLPVFGREHPDKCGGYSFFGWADTLYALGIAIVLIEVLLLMATHRNVTLGNVLAFLGIGAGAILISYLSVAEALRLTHRLERRLKTASFGRRMRGSGRSSVEYATLMFGLRFSPYTAIAGKLAIGLRAVFALPGLVRLTQLLGGATV